MISGNVKRKPVLIASFLILVVCLVTLKCSQRIDTGLQKLATDFRAANQSSTIEPMLALYHLEGSNNLNITHLRGALQYELGLPIKKIEFEPLSGAPEETIEFTHNNIRYGPTLQPCYRMRVTYNGKDRFVSLYTIGKTKTGNWRFIAAKPVVASDN